MRVSPITPPAGLVALVVARVAGAAGTGNVATGPCVTFGPYEPGNCAMDGTMQAAAAVDRLAGVMVIAGSSRSAP
jgi:hypothetical protein